MNNDPNNSTPPATPGAAAGAPAAAKATATMMPSTLRPAVKVTAPSPAKDFPVGTPAVERSPWKKARAIELGELPNPTAKK